MKRTGNLKKILALVAIFPLLSACGTLSTATISNGLDRNRLTYAEAQDAIANGANVKDDFAGNCFIKQAADQKRWDLVTLFIENGANPWDAPHGKHKPFSTFNFIVDPRKDIPDETRLKVLDLCLAHKDDSPMVAEMQATAFVSDPKARPSEFRTAAIAKIAEAGLAAASVEKYKRQDAGKATEELRSACLRGALSTSALEAFIARGADVNATDERGLSILYIAEREKQSEEVLATLVAAGAVKNEADLAAENAEKQLATKKLISAVKVSSSSFIDLKNINRLIALGADVNATDENGFSILYIAEREKQSEEVLATLVAAGAVKNERDLAAEKQLATKKLLAKVKERGGDGLWFIEYRKMIEQGADVNATDENGFSILYIAEREKQSEEVLATLVAAGAVKNERDLAAEKQLATKKLISAFKVSYTSDIDPENINRLIALGADVNAKDENGFSILFLAKQRGVPENVLAPLILAGAKENDYDRAYRAAELIILCKGSDSNNKDTSKTDPRRVQALIDSGVDVNAHDKYGNSALFLAKLNGKTEIIPLLTQAGAKMNPGEPEKLKEEATKKLFKLAGEWEAKNVKEKAELYIGRGADVNAKDENGHSLLFNALLVRSAQGGVGAMGATMMKDSLGAMGMGQHGEEGAAVMRAMVGDNQEGLFSSPLCVALINAGAKASKDELTTIYFINLKTGNWSAIKEFRDRNFDLRAEGEGGKNAFHVLSENQLVSPNESVVDALVKAGVNMEKKAEFDDAFLTPLGYAIKNKHVEAVRILLEHGANRKATVIIKDVMGNRSVSLTDFAKDKYNKAKRAQDLALTRGITINSMQLIAMLDAAVQDYQKIISMLEK